MLGYGHGARVIKITEDPFTITSWFRFENNTKLMTRDQPIHEPGSKYQIACEKSFKYLILVTTLPYIITGTVVGCVLGGVAIGFWSQAKRAKKYAQVQQALELVDI
jgi:hypothetical protein